MAKLKVRKPLDQRLPEFHAWLTEQGATVYPPTNPYEVTRFRTAAGVVSIIYRNKAGRISAMTGAAQSAVDRFNGIPEPDMFATGLDPGDSFMAALAKRDGNACFYCGRTFTTHLRATKEHILARAHGGPNHIANMALACSPCNGRAGSMSVVEKILLRDLIRHEQNQSTDLDGGTVHSDPVHDSQAEGGLRQ